MQGLGKWAESLSKARDMVSQMTLEEKVSLTGGVVTANGCAGNIPAVARVDFPGMCLHDAGNGVRATDFVNSYPSGIHVGASWNRNLTRNRGAMMGGEFKTKGVNVLLGPVAGPIGRVVRGGRVWEGFSVDPYLSGALVAESVLGMQGAGVITSTKHYVANEQETNRIPIGDVQAVSANVDDRTMHELYLWPFQDAVRAGSGNVMCSYQRLNNSYGCANSKALNGLLKTELGFQGFVVTDWGAQHAGHAAALAGLDVAMPSSGGYFGDRLVEAVRNGSVPESRVADMATRVVASWYRMGQDRGFPPPGVGMPANVLEDHDLVDARADEAVPVLFAGAVEGHVLVKNANGALPLRSPRLLSLFGYSAKSPDVLAPGGTTGPGDSWSFGSQPVDVRETVAGFVELRDVPHSAFGRKGTMISGGGSGATSPADAVSPFEALKLRARQDGTAVWWDFESATPGTNPLSDACLVLGNAWASESYDRPGLRDDHTDGLVRHVADRCNNTIVVLHNAGARLVDGFVDHPNVTAVVFAHLPGQDSGPALAALLYGDENPSGKLPYVVARNESDYGRLEGPDLPRGAFAAFPQSDFAEGVFVDYKHFDAHGIAPRYPFGFGLGYTTFAYDGLELDAVPGADVDEFPTGEVVEGGQADLWDVLATAAVTVRNTGPVDGKEVAQLYLSVPRDGDEAATPARQLRGFDKREVRAGQSARFGFELTRRDLSVWDVAVQRWRLRRGDYTVTVGPDSGNQPLAGVFSM